MVRFLIECDKMYNPTTPAGNVLFEIDEESASCEEKLGFCAGISLVKKVPFVTLWSLGNKNADMSGRIALDIPIGRTDFVDGILARQTHNSVTHVRPLLIPDCLNRKDFVQRRVGHVLNMAELATVQRFWPKSSLYVTDTQRVHSANLYPSIAASGMEEGAYMVSEMMPRSAAIWRAFFLDDRIIHVALMKGQKSKDLNVDFLNQVCRTFVDSGEAPRAFFMDFGVRHDGSTFLMQVNNAISNYGLQGILDKPDDLASMLVWGWLNELASAQVLDEYALPCLLKYKNL